MGAPELPDDPTPDQVAAWVELATLLRDPDFIASSRRMAQRALAEGPEPDPAQFNVGQALSEQAGAAVRDGVVPDSPEALAVVERMEAMAPGATQDRTAAADRIDAFTDHRIARYWTLVGIVNGWPQDQTPTPEEHVDTWQCHSPPCAHMPRGASDTCRRCSYSVCCSYSVPHPGRSRSSRSRISGAGGMCGRRAPVLAL